MKSKKKKKVKLIVICGIAFTRSRMVLLGVEWLLLGAGRWGQRENINQAYNFKLEDE